MILVDKWRIELKPASWKGNFVGDTPVLHREDGSEIGVGDPVEFISSEDVNAEGSAEAALQVAQQNAPKIMDELVQTSLSKVLPAETKIKAAGLVLSYGLGLPSRGKTLEARKMTTASLNAALEKFVEQAKKMKEEEDE